MAFRVGWSASVADSLRLRVRTLASEPRIPSVPSAHLPVGRPGDMVWQPSGTEHSSPRRSVPGRGVGARRILGQRGRSHRRPRVTAAERRACAETRPVWADTAPGAGRIAGRYAPNCLRVNSIVRYERSFSWRACGSAGLDRVRGARTVARGGVHSLYDGPVGKPRPDQEQTGKRLTRSRQCEGPSMRPEYQPYTTSGRGSLSAQSSDVLCSLHAPFSQGSVRTQLVTNLCFPGGLVLFRSAAATARGIRWASVLDCRPVRGGCLAERARTRAARTGVSA